VIGYFEIDTAQLVAEPKSKDEQNHHGDEGQSHDEHTVNHLYSALNTNSIFYS